MDSNWATEHLQTIRTLMERSAIYRRAMAPIMLLLGVLGIVAAFAAWKLALETGRAFGLFWMGISIAGICGAYLMVRRQALKAGEDFWSPPTRRVTQALVPALFAGAVAGLLLIVPGRADAPTPWWTPSVWMVLYGCAIHAAGFFMPRGIRLFGWAFILSGCGLSVGLWWSGTEFHPLLAHGVMGGFFGGYHLAYGVYLSFTEKPANEA